MAADFLQISALRRFILLTLPVYLAACISSQPFPQGVLEAQPKPTPLVRAPKVGQEWVYQVRNVFNQEIVDIVTEKVVSVGNDVRITRTSHKTGSLPDEIQSSWGFIVQDPHWKPTQKFSKPMPMWPLELQTGWDKFFATQYQVPEYTDGSYYWGLSMAASQWEWVTTPAGQFLVLRIHNEMPNFVSNDLFRVGNERQEDLWFAPEIGRWAIRRSLGRYLTPGVSWANAYWEDYLQWELISWK